MREYRATVGATDGSIIAAIITTQTPTNQPRVPRPVQDPSSMPLICSLVHDQQRMASASNRPMRPRRARADVRRGARPAVAEARSGVAAIIPSGGPGELGCREPRLPLVLDAEGIDLRALRLRHRQIGPGRVKHVLEPHRLTVLNTERDDVLDFERDGVADPHAVADAVIRYFDRRSLDAQYLSDKRRERFHGAAELSAEDARQLLELLVARFVGHKHAEPPVAVGHDLGR